MDDQTTKMPAVAERAGGGMCIGGNQQTIHEVPELGVLEEPRVSLAEGSLMVHDGHSPMKIEDCPHECGRRSTLVRAIFG